MASTARSSLTPRKPVCRRERGTSFGDGAAGTWFWVHPANDVVFAAMIQRMTHPDKHTLQYLSQATVYQVLVDPSR
jgi:CubicO group peptidase (beta-lactamase class C family)